MQNYLKKGKELLSKAVTWFNRLPNNTYPLGGLTSYNASIEEYGRENIFAPHNIWRQAFHFSGGILLAVAVTPILHPFEALLTAVVITIKEAKDGKNKIKNYVDLLIWLAGSVTLTIVIMNLNELIEKLKQVF